tara:strand:- start:1713 stop:2162 length:450 start_codon:yes stop_codon:yes gene_type:complete
MKIKKLIILLAIFSTILLNKVAFSNSFGIIKYRQNMMKATAGHMGTIVGIIKNNLTFENHIVDHAYSLMILSKMTIDIFPEGTGEGRTKAKKSIWENWQKFEKASQNFVDESTKLFQIAKEGDMKALAIQIRKTGKTCSGCHRNFRKRD